MKRFSLELWVTSLRLIGGTCTTRSNEESSPVELTRSLRCFGLIKQELLVWLRLPIGSRDSSDWWAGSPFECYWRLSSFHAHLRGRPTSGQWGSQPLDKHMDDAGPALHARYPFSDHKWRGGSRSTGLVTGSARFHIGIAEKRCHWVVASIGSMEQAGWLVDVRRFHKLRGRLGFMSQVLPWIRPFLAPGYSWLSVVRRGAVLSLPNLVRCVLRFIVDRLNRGIRTHPAGVPERDIGEIFRTDAACNDNCVVLGGWFLHLGHDTIRWLLGFNLRSRRWMHPGSSVTARVHGQVLQLSYYHRSWPSTYCNGSLAVF